MFPNEYCNGCIVIAQYVVPFGVTAPGSPHQFGDIVALFFLWFLQRSFRFIESNHTTSNKAIKQGEQKIWVNDCELSKMDADNFDLPNLREKQPHNRESSRNTMSHFKKKWYVRACTAAEETIDIIQFIQELNVTCVFVLQLKETIDIIQFIQGNKSFLSLALTITETAREGGHFQTHSDGHFQDTKHFRIHFYCQGTSFWVTRRRGSSPNTREGSFSNSKTKPGFIFKHFLTAWTEVLTTLTMSLYVKASFMV